MYGILFLALIGGIGGYLLWNAYSGGAGFLTGTLYEPLTTSTFYTDWLTWSLGDYTGWFLLVGMFLFLGVLAVQSMTGNNDTFR